MEVRTLTPSSTQPSCVLRYTSAIRLLFSLSTANSVLAIARLAAETAAAKALLSVGSFAASWISSSRDTALSTSTSAVTEFALDFFRSFCASVMILMALWHNDGSFERLARRTAGGNRLNTRGVDLGASSLT